MKKHGLNKHYLYPTWNAMNARCYNKKSINYQDYGGRGISVYDGWKDSPVEFITYVEETLGEKPSGCSLDRIDNNLGYIPGNIRWASWRDQARNRRNNKLCNVDGVEKTFYEWLEEYDLKYGTVVRRMRKGLSFKEALSHKMFSAIDKDRKKVFSSQTSTGIAGVVRHQTGYKVRMSSKYIGFTTDFEEAVAMRLAAEDCSGFYDNSLTDARVFVSKKIKEHSARR